MSEWKRVKLGDCLEFLNGKSIKVQSCGVWPVYGSNGIIGYSEQYLYENAIVLGRVGAYCGSVARESGKFWASDNTIVVKSKDSVDIDFCYYQMKIMRLNNYAGGAAQPLITHSILNGLSLSLPPLATQRRIASVLSNYDSAIANCRRQIALLEEAVMRLYKEWFRDGKGENKTLGDLIVEIESGSRPRGGAVKSGIPSIGAEKIDGIGNYDYTGEKFVSREYFDRMKRGKIQDEDILLYKDGAYCGKVSMVLDGFPHKEAATNEHVFILRTDRHSAFLYCFLRQRKSFELLNKLACNKAAQPGLNQQDVLGVKIAIPPQDDMGSFENKVMPIMHTIAFLANQIRALTEARDRLLPKLMKGEIAV